MRRLFSLIAVLFVAALFASAARAEKRVALVIGNSAYRHVTPLRNPGNDAGDVRNKLEALGFQLFGGTDLDRTGMMSSLTGFGRAAENADVALVFYAGHGLQVNGQNYLVPVDANVEFEAELDIALVPFSIVMQQLARGSRINIALLDACRDNPFSQGLSRSMGTRAVGSLGRGLSRVRSASGTFIAYATEPDAVAQDGEGRNSPFTAALLKNIDKPGLSLSDLMIEVRNDVLQATNGKQTPWDTSSLTGRFSFRIEGTVTISPQTDVLPPAAAPPPADARVADMMAWLAAQGSGDPLDVETYLQNFPSGMYVRQAQQKLQAMRSPQTPQSSTAVPPPQSVNPPVSDPLAVQRERWTAAASSSDPRLFEKFLQDYPDGALAAEAANNLGVLYDNGTGVPRDQALAIRWFQRGADLGSSHAANNLGNKYATGNGVTRDDVRAAALYRRGAELGHPDAMTNLGIMLASGRGGVRDEAQAVEWYRRSQIPNGVMLLAGMVDGGRGVKRDPEEAAELYLECTRVGQPTCRAILVDQRGKQVSIETRRIIQRKLKEKGFYTGAIDGNFGPAVTKALEKLAGR